MSAVAIDGMALARAALLGVVVALGPLAWWWLRHRGAKPAQRLHRLTLLTLFLTFDLVLFGAFTRLTDSGLGCPDWPGCYGSASPFGAGTDIQAAEHALPSGPVTQGKAWVEMLHRYLAAAVGVLIAVLAAMGWWLRRRRRRVAPYAGWPALTLAWVIAQGAFGALTVTMKLYPAIVTLHLLGGLGLLALLVLQDQAYAPRRLYVARPVLTAAGWVAALTLVQVLLGGWVSTNYAVLACRDFPMCQGQWWPPMDFGHAFTLRRGLGETSSGAFLPFAALTAIHVVHRIGAAVLLSAMAALAWRLYAAGDAILRRYAAGVALIALWQLASGWSNVVLGWPLAAALAHSGGAAMLTLVLTSLLARGHMHASVAPVPLRRV